MTLVMTLLMIILRTLLINPIDDRIDDLIENLIEDDNGIKVNNFYVAGVRTNELLTTEATLESPADPLVLQWKYVRGQPRSKAGRWRGGDQIV